ncbi:aldose 1-epimerase family protein [Streptococcus sp. 20-1249]|uniref:aldose 1-epimerase family protein n=1 Tax=Streptococcus hepaticus TaxID=3349163 RepID=UPI00374913D7
MKYTLENQDLIVTFDSLGGQLTSIKNHEGLEYLWQADPQYWAGQAPVLFPICGSLRNNTAQTEDGQTIRMPRHGIVRKREFVLEKQTDSEIIFSITADQEMLAQYPFAFKLFLQYQLVGQQIQVNYIVNNLEKRPIPIFIGGHPAFNCPLDKSLQFEDYMIEFEQEERKELPSPILEKGLLDRENRQVLDFDRRHIALTHDLFSEDALVFDHAQSKEVTLRSSKSPHSVTLICQDFANILVWSAKGGPFIALEPTSGASTFMDEDDIFEHKDNVRMIPAQDSAFYSYQLRFQ